MPEYDDNGLIKADYEIYFYAKDHLVEVFDIDNSILMSAEEQNEILRFSERFPFSIDNATIHSNRFMDPNIKSKIIYNLPYCPSYNQIEYFFNTFEAKEELILSLYWS